MKLMNLKRLWIILFVLLTLSGIYFAVKKIYPFKYKEDIIRYSKEYNVDPYLVVAVIKAESNFAEDARSNKNALGLMQITENTARWIAEQLGMENFQTNKLMEPDINIRMGCWYLNNLDQEFRGDADLILAAYNAGRGNVNNWLQNNEYSKDGRKLYYIPFKETDKYIKRVKVNYNIYKALYKTL